MKKIKRVLWVCLGNTARSPAALYLARDLKNKFTELKDVFFDSAGFINAFSYMQPESQEYLNSKGITFADFKPQIINRHLLEKQDLILTMEESHSEDIISDYYNIKDIDKKTFTLKEFVGEKENLSIHDPYYTSRENYKKIIKIIHESVENAIKKIIEINKSI